MSVNPQAGRAYQLPEDISTPLPPPAAGGSYVPNPDGAEAGPLYLSPEAEGWIKSNVIDQGYYIDWGTRTYFDAETGETKGTIPTSFPRMI